MWLLMAWCVGCGGGADKRPPAPVITQPTLSIATTSLPPATFSQYYSATLQTTGGIGKLEWNIGSGELPFGLSLDHDNGIISGIITRDFLRTQSFIALVRDSAGRIASQQYTMAFASNPANLKFLTSSLPAALANHSYKATILLNQPASPLRFSAGSKTLPPGLELQGSVIVGKPTDVGSFEFTLEAQNAAVTVQQKFQLNIKASGARNNDLADATLLSNSVYFASISPYADPVSQADPDEDYYKLRAQPGSVVSVEIFSERNGAPLDSVLELVDSSGARLTTCDEPGTSGFTRPCMNDDNLEEFTLDSKLLFKAPAGEPTTFFLHVLDWRGDARPDMQYQIEIFGAD